MHELMGVELMRERRLDLMREARAAGVGRGAGGGLGKMVRGWMRRVVVALGYGGMGVSRDEPKEVERAREVLCRRVARKSRRYCVDSKAALSRFQAAVANQMALSGGDPAVEAAGRALREVLGPAARQLALELTEQAAAEVNGQLPHHRVDVVLRGGEPALEVRTAGEAEEKPSGEEYEARISLRLPPSLKSAIEDAARAAGESVNSYLVRDLTRSTSRPGRVGKRMKGTVRT